MKKNSLEYRRWKIKQNKKNLLRRTKRKKQKKHVSLPSYEKKAIQNNEYNIRTKEYEFHAPLVFSFINNSEGTIEFFNKLISFICNKRNFGRKLFIDISSINCLTIDALMYLLAIVNNLNTNFKGKYSFSGNEPANETVKKLFSESGFYHFVRRQSQGPLSRNNDNVQIISGERYNTESAKAMSDFVSEKANIDVRKCGFLYNMFIELMSNTQRHAYPDANPVMYSRWYCFAEYDGHNIISFSFMDTGAGIPATVKKNFSERIDFLGIKSDDKYVISALNGDFRTSTELPYRGKGLPTIRDLCCKQKIENLRIITNKADVSVLEETYRSDNMSRSLQGTLYYWQVNLSNF